MKENNSKKEIPTAIKKTQLPEETEMSKKNKKILEIIRAYKRMFG